MLIKDTYKIWEATKLSVDYRVGLKFISVFVHDKFGPVATATNGFLAVWVPVEIDKNDMPGIIPAWFMERAWLGREAENTGFLRFNMSDKNSVGAYTKKGFGLSNGYSYVARNTILDAKGFEQVNLEDVQFPSQHLDVLLSDVSALRSVETPFVNAELLVLAQNAIGGNQVRIYGTQNARYPSPHFKSVYAVRSDNPHAKEVLKPPFALIMPMKMEQGDL